jgi:aspartyl-tRNA synthetase
MSSLFKGSNFQLFANVVESGGIIKALPIPGGGATFSATSLKKGDLHQQAIKSGAKGLPFLKITDEGISCFCRNQVLCFLVNIYTTKGMFVIK